MGKSSKQNPLPKRSVLSVDLVRCAKTVSLTLLAVYVGIPLFVKINPWILSKVVFSNNLKWPTFLNLSHPEDFGIENSRNFRLHVEDDVTLGAWHVLPVSSSVNVQEDQFERELSKGKKIVLYLHGNSGTRGSTHRVELYNLLSELDVHVIAFDYRGYGDSSGQPSEDGLVADAYFVYKWLKERGGNQIFLWGHSLGTGVACKLAKKLDEENAAPAGVILEAPFTNLEEASFSHPFAQAFKILPWFEQIFVEPLKDQGIFFKNDENILSISSPTLILHAKDDFIVPVSLGEKLYNVAKVDKNGKTRDVDFLTYEGSHGYGHKYICRDPQLPNTIQKFMAKSKKPASSL